ncbi:hypothetical protein [Methylobacterium sp. ID0610]|uniref:hypothetical protein n=1 Tax=Methylobacterium carpenticola TaxID=3344827 RepID=UPI0036A44BC7
MIDYLDEAADLVRADLHIAEGEQRMLDLAGSIERSRTAGWDTTVAEKTVHLMHETMEQWWIHRQLIAATLTRRG